MDTIKIDARDVNFWYGDFHALKGISMEIEEKSVVAFIGPSGCGKSTFLRLFNRMNDLIPATRLEGEIRIDGHNIYAKGVEVDELRKNVGMVFQRPNPFPKSIFENVAYGLRVNGVKDNAFIRQRVEETLKGAALWDEVKDKLKESAYALSGGQQQRLCIARAMAVSPSVLLMDEPASALDPISTAKVEELIHELKKDYTIVIVTHNMQQAVRISDKTAFFLLGEIIEYNDTTELFSRPQNKKTEESKDEAKDDKLDLGLDVDSVTVATSPGYEPFEFEEDGELKGYDVDIWNEFSERTGIEVKWEYADFSGLLGLLSSGKADAVSAQMSPTEERKDSYLFSDPVDYYGSTVVVGKDNDEIKSVKDLSGKTVGVGSGNSMQQAVEDMYPKGDVKFEVYTSATLEAMFDDIAYGRIDAVLAQDIQTYMAMKANKNLKIKVLEPFAYDTATIVFAKDNTELCDAMNKFIKIIKEDGTLQEISEKWIGADITTKKE